MIKSKCSYIKQIKSSKLKLLLCFRCVLPPERLVEEVFSALSLSQGHLTVITVDSVASRECPKLCPKLSQ